MTGLQCPSQTSKNISPVIPSTSRCHPSGTRRHGSNMRSGDTSMSSLRRIQASRANGAKSRGPVTPPGKARSARNALKHGLLSTDVVLASESKQPSKHPLDARVARWQPADQAELGCVEHMAAADWRIRRLWAVETRDIDD